MTLCPHVLQGPLLCPGHVGDVFNEDMIMVQLLRRDAETGLWG